VGQDERIDEVLSEAELGQFFEGVDFEAKKAAGREGKGELPSSFFDTYSAMANTTGGFVLLGAEEGEDGRLKAFGIVDLARVRKQLWDALNNPQKVSVNLLREQDVTVLDVDGRKLLRVRVPRATREQRPVYVGENPFARQRHFGTFRRNYEGDYQLGPEEIRRMMAEQVEQERDARILAGFSMADRDAETLAKYRQSFRTLRPSHRWNALDDEQFLLQTGGRAHDRATGVVGVTAAGLLMFGQLSAIEQAFPYYRLDYREVVPGGERWADRVTTDGLGADNVFDFFQVVIRRLFRDLKVPFRLEGEVRVGETRVHEALREALVNALTHADYTGRSAVTILREAGLYRFENPGGLRMPPAQAKAGTHSDCRNRTLQKMFHLVGLAERIGSGLMNIYETWHERHWREPELSEEFEPERTILLLTTVSLLPSDTLAALEQRLGPRFQELDELQCAALVTVELEGSVTHARLREMTSKHSREVTLALSSLVQRGLLRSSGQHRLTSYTWPPSLLPDPSQPRRPLSFEPNRPVAESDESNSEPRQSNSEPVKRSSELSGPSSELSEPNSELSEPNSELSEPNSELSGPNSELSGPNSELSGPNSELSEPNSELSGPNSELSGPNSELSEPVGEPKAIEWAELERIAAPFRAAKRAQREVAERVILKLCQGRYLTLDELARLTGKRTDSLRTSHLYRMVESGRLRLRHPDKPNHPRQAYTTILLCCRTLVCRQRKKGVRSRPPGAAPASRGQGDWPAPAS
jgi:ATP-dependent DNA helicase RecG